MSPCRVNIISRSDDPKWNVLWWHSQAQDPLSHHLIGCSRVWAACLKISPTVSLLKCRSRACFLLRRCPDTFRSLISYGMGVGAFHSGVVVGGVEYTFGDFCRPISTFLRTVLWKCQWKSRTDHAKTKKTALHASMKTSHNIQEKAMSHSSLQVCVENAQRPLEINWACVRFLRVYFFGLLASPETVGSRGDPWLPRNTHS